MDKVIYDSYEILKKFADCTGEYVTEDALREIRKYLKRKEYFNENVLRVAIVGRVNAGKSTLTNALVGKVIAQMRGRESTSWNTTFWPSSNELCLVTNEEDKVEELSVEEFIKVLNDKEQRKEFLKDKKSIDVFFETKDIHFAILDIPGVATQNKANEILALEAVRESDLVLFTIPANSSVSGEDIAIYRELKKNKKPVEFVITKADYRDDEGIQEMRAEIQEYFQVEHVLSISADGCLKGDEASLDDRKKLIERINMHQIIAKEERIKNNISFESECIRILQKVQAKALFDIDKKFAKKYEELYFLQERAEELTQLVREELSNSIKEKYCAPFKETIIKEMTSVPVEKCKVAIAAILEKHISEEYLVEYWQAEVATIESMIDQAWEDGIADKEQLKQYVGVLKSGRTGIAAKSFDWSEDGQMFGGMRTSIGLGAVASFYQAVLGPMAEYVTITGAMTSIGLPLAAIGAGISIALGLMSEGEQEYLSAERAEKILEEELRKNALEIITRILDATERINKRCITLEFEKQEEKNRNSLPEGMRDADFAIQTLEQVSTILLNRDLVLREQIHFYLNCPAEKITEIKYVDPVEQEIDAFLGEIEDLREQGYFDSFGRIVFMPILFLQDEGKAYIKRILRDICLNKSSIQKNIQSDYSGKAFCYEDDFCAIYYSREWGKKKIKLEYIDVYKRDIQKYDLFKKRIREGSILSDFQMRRKIISDISRAREKVEILVPWMKGAMFKKSDKDKMSMADAIGLALKNGATVVIGCGNSEDGDKEDEILSKDMKEKLLETYGQYFQRGKLVFYMNSFTHEKFLAVDNKIAMCGSYNFLSNVGRFHEKSFSKNRKDGYGKKGSSGVSGTTEYPGESMKLTENVESIEEIRDRMKAKYQ